LVTPISRHTEPNFQFLGGPVSVRDEFKSEWVLSKVDDLIKDIRVCAELEDPQIAYNLFKYCFSYPRIVHILRTVPPHISSVALKSLSVEYRSLIESIVGSNISDQAFLQASLGLQVGGLGLRNPVQHAFAGYLASVNKCAPFVEKLIRAQGATFWSLLNIVLTFLILLFPC